MMTLSKVMEGGKPTPPLVYLRPKKPGSNKLTRKPQPNDDVHNGVMFGWKPYI